MQYGHGGRVVPAIWFRYELSPITVRYIEKNKPFYTFLTTVSDARLCSDSSVWGMIIQSPKPMD